MKNFSDIQTEAARQWNELHSGATPVIYIGAATCGIAAGALDVSESVRATLARHNIEARVVHVGCIGPCYLEPLMDIALPGAPRISYANMTPELAARIVENQFLRDDPSLDFAVAHLGKNGDAEALGLPPFFELPMLKSQVRLVLRNCGFIDPESIDHYIANDGYKGILHAFNIGAQAVIDEVREAGIRGRGGAGFPTFKKWQFCRNAPGEDKYIICNCSEGDPGAFMNRSLIESDPHCVLEGLLIAGYAIGASHGYVYINSDYKLAIARLNVGIAQMKEYGLLGDDVLGSGFPFDIIVKEGAGAFVCGEETALIASIEGRRGMPRSRPPFPAISGLKQKPTIINNVETLGTLPNILRNGATWYRQFGVQGNYGTKTFSLTGKVRRPGLIEVPLGIKLREIIEGIGGGSWRPFKAVQTGGPSGGCLSAEYLDLPVEYEAMANAGSIMGSGGMIVLDEDTCVVDLALYFLHFTQAESCGKCAPCRVGTWHMVTLLENMSKGESRPEDITRLQVLGETVKRASLCGLGQTAPNPALTTLRHFRNEYLEHAKEGYCAAAVCKDLVTYSIDAQRCNGCQLCKNVCPTNAISGVRAEVHTIDLNRCIKCRACYEVCRYHPLAGNAVVYASTRRTVA
ncbi:MAG: 4Fe-4S binding protein [Bacteroidetes bacterium]|nr:4Fe-4S binding protein [Bacteroidota bacterium]